MLTAPVPAPTSPTSDRRLHFLLHDIAAKSLRDTKRNNADNKMQLLGVDIDVVRSTAGGEFHLGEQFLPKLIERNQLSLPRP
jgi:hypothetical protein